MTDDKTKSANSANLARKVIFWLPPVFATAFFVVAWVSKDDEVREAERLRAEQQQSEIQACKDAWLGWSETAADKHVEQSETDKFQPIISDCYSKGRLYVRDKEGNWRRVP